MSTATSTPAPRRALREFMQNEVAGGVVLLVAAIVALVWANSGAADSYERLWHTEVGLEIGNWRLQEDLRHWVNDLLMALFFFVVGLEIKRELVSGELREWRNAALPAIAALGGMVVPALLYTAFNAGGEGSRGWGVPMATDIAFAVGVVTLLGRRVPTPLKLFLLTLAIVDDIGAIVVIAIFYAGGVEPLALGAAAALIAGIVVLRLLRVDWAPVYFVLGFATWYATFESGVHATIAGVVLGLLVPAKPREPAEVVKEWAEDLEYAPTVHDAATLTGLARSTVSTSERLEHDLSPWTSFLIVPLFALANAGVRLEGGGTAAVTIGVVVGLVVGKFLGVFGASWIGVKLGVGRLPTGVSWFQLGGAAAVAGVGFTVALFVAGLAFDDPELESSAKLGILAGSLIAAVIGAALLAVAGRNAPAPEASTI